MLQAPQNSLGTQRPAMYVRRMSGVNAIRELAQNSAYTAQNSTKLAQKSQCLRSAVTVREHGVIDEYDNVQTANDTAYVTISVRGMVQKSACVAQNSTKVAQNSQCCRPPKIRWEHRDQHECHNVHMTCHYLPYGAWHKIWRVRHKIAQK